MYFKILEQKLLHISNLVLVTNMLTDIGFKRKAGICFCKKKKITHLFGHELITNNYLINIFKLKQLNLCFVNNLSIVQMIYDVNYIIITI